MKKLHSPTTTPTIVLSVLISLRFSITRTLLCFRFLYALMLCVCGGYLEMVWILFKVDMCLVQHRSISIGSIYFFFQLFRQIRNNTLCVYVVVGVWLVWLDLGARYIQCFSHRWNALWFNQSMRLERKFSNRFRICRTKIDFVPYLWFFLWIPNTAHIENMQIVHTIWIIVFPFENESAITGMVQYSILSLHLTKNLSNLQVHLSCG